jgi:hypothetical protein
MGIIKAEDLGRLSPVFRGKGGQKLAKFFMRLMALDKINDLCDRSSHCTGADFASSMLEDLGVDYMVGNSERLKQLPERAFITISNHPYGGVDGIILIDLFGHLRPDYKFMVNQVLALVKALESHFISVTPAGNKKRLLPLPAFAVFAKPLPICMKATPWDSSLRAPCRISA